MMTPPAPLPLAPFDDVLQALLAPLAPVSARDLPLEAAEGRIAAGTRAEAPIPARDLARLDGHAVAALDLVGASALSPVLLAAAPYLSCGAELPPDADAMLSADLIERRGPMSLALGEVLPGEGVLRRGGWLSPGDWIAAPGARISGAELLLAEEAGLSSLACRVPRVALLDVSGCPGPSFRRVAAALRRLGADLRPAEADDLAVAAEGADLLLTLGGTGAGPEDRTAGRIAQAGVLLSHGIGFSGAPTLATGRIAGVPLIALPGAPEAAMAGLLALAAPLLARLSGCRAAAPLNLPLKRKVASAVGQAELLLLARDGGGWLPAPPGALSPAVWREAAAWRMVGAGEEGWAEGTPLSAELLEGGLPV